MLDIPSLDVLVRQVIGALFFPPLNGMLLLLVAALWRRRQPRRGNLLGAFALFLLYMQSTPWLAMQLASGLERSPPASLSAVRQTSAIVVLGGGKRPAPEYEGYVPNSDTQARLRYAAFLARATGLPLLVSGGAPVGGEPEALVMARTLQQDYGISPRWIEPGSDNTGDNARLSARLLHAANVGRITLVTQAWHMARAAPLFRASGLQVVPAPTGFIRYDGYWLVHWLPSGRAMKEVLQAEHEWLGLLYYRLRPQ